MKLVFVSYAQSRLNFFREQLAAANRRLDWSIRHNPDWYDQSEKGEVVSFYEWSVKMAEKTVQDWVPVKDGLPERPPDRVDEQGRSWFTPNIDCIVYDGKSVFAANYCFQNKCFWCADTLHPLKNITHWMPMPDPPKGD